MKIDKPYLLFLGDGDQAKTAKGVAYWRPELCAGQLRLPGCSVDVGLPDMTIPEAAAGGVKTFVIGVAPHGGALPERWQPLLVQALEAGLDIVSGLHSRLTDIPVLRDAATANGCSLFDVRHPQQRFAAATGAPRRGNRLLTVGTDCEVGKMYTTLALWREMQARGMHADFRATGQTGILIAGSGVAVDAVVSDFVAGAAEWLAPENSDDHWDLIEGQGSLFHPAYAGVTLGLVHGSQAQTLVLCHDATRRTIVDYDAFPIRPFADCIAAYESAARLTSPKARCIGLSINTSGLSESDAEAYLGRVQDEVGLPCVDPVRTGVGRLVDALPAPTSA